MKQTIKFLFYTLKYVSIVVSIPFLVTTTITSFFYFIFSELSDWANVKLNEYED